MASLNRTFPRIPAGPGRGIAFLAAVLLFALPVAAKADAYRDTALAFAQRMVQFFPPAEGYVVSLPAGEVYIDLTEADLMRPGMELLVYREGKDIVHPVTGDVLGKYEEKLGYLTIREVNEKYTVGTLSEDAGEVVAGDRVRISSRPLRALLFLSGESPALATGEMAQVLQDAAGESKRLRLRDEPEWLPLLKELGVTIDEVLSEGASLRRLGEEAKADLIVVVTLPGDEGEALGFEVRSLWTGRTLLEFSEPWTAPAPAAAAPSGSPGTSSPFRIFPRREQSEPKREYVTKNLSAAGLDIVAGDFTGSGGLQIMVSDGSGLTLYQWEQGGLIWKWESEDSPGWKILHVDAADFEGDGRNELLVVKVRRGDLLSEAFAWDSGEWHSLGRISGIYLRALGGGAGPSVLLGQRAGVNTVFSGPVREYVREGDSFRPADGMKLPSGVGIFGTTLADVDGDGEGEILTLSDGGRLRVLTPDGDLLFETRDRYNGYPARVEATELFGARLIEGGVNDGYFTGSTPDDTTGKDSMTDIFSAFQGRILTARDADGALVVSLPRNGSGPGKLLPNLRKFDKGDVVLLRWEGGRFEEFRQSRRQDGFVSDIAWADTDGDGVDEILVTVNSPEGALLKKRGSLVVWSHSMSSGLPGKGE